MGRKYTYPSSELCDSLMHEGVLLVRSVKYLETFDPEPLLTKGDN